MDRIKQLWFPIAILVIILVTAGWILAMVLNPNSVQSSEQVLVPTDPPTAVIDPTRVPSSTPSPTPTPTVVATSTPSANPTSDCTYSMEYWSMNTDAWVIENIVLGNRSYNIVEAVAILDSEEPGSIERLMAAFFTTLLNTLNGADSTEIDQAVVEARDWLVLRPHGIGLSESEILEIEALADQLEDYNNGLTGPGLCDDGITTPTPGEISRSPTPADTTPTPTPTVTTAPTEGITATLPATSTTAPGATLPRPTATATKDSGGGSKPKPTKTPPPPQPTNPPPPPPTNPPPPPPTNPPPTPAPTQEPEPTQSP